MVPGEYKLAQEPIQCLTERKTVTLRVANTGDRPIQVGSHFHFVEVNRYLAFERDQAVGFRLNIPAGAAVRFEPGEDKEVELVALGGAQVVYGLNGLCNGPVKDKNLILERMQEKGFVGPDEGGETS